LKVLGFFKFARINFYLPHIFYSSGIYDKQRYLEIPLKTLKMLKYNCPRLLSICDNKSGEIYRSSVENGGKLCRTSEIPIDI
jgi:hypothetical protein